MIKNKAQVQSKETKKVEIWSLLPDVPEIVYIHMHAYGEHPAYTEGLRRR